MKKRNHLFAITTAVLLTASLLSGCGGNSVTRQNSSSSADSNTLRFCNTSLTGTVTAVDGNTVTLSLAGGMGGGQTPPGQPSGSGDGQNPPEQPSDSSDGQTPPEQPSGSGDGQNPPEQPSDSSDGQTPPEQPSDSSDGQNPPEQPSGSGDGQTPPEQPSGNAGRQMGGTTTAFTLTLSDDSVLQDASLSDITEGVMLTISFDDSGTISSVTVTGQSSGNPSGGSPENGNASGNSTVNTGTGATTVTEDTEEANVSFSSEKEDENALRVEGSVSYSGTNLTIRKSAGNTTNTESSDFYGLNAGFLCLDGAASTLTDSKISTDAQGANGIFAYGEQTSVTVSNTDITTTADNSGGIDVTGGASLQASNLNIETDGKSSAAIRSDRGGGTLTVSSGTYTTNGTGSPAVYCTADISVSDAVLTANASEGIVIEGKNSVSLENCDISSNMQGTYQGDESENLHTIMIYQSMSGDADEGSGTLTVSGGSITGQNGDLIYSTNTTSILNLSHTQLTLSNDVLLRLAGNDGTRGWGKAGSNGADMCLFATAQQLNGKIIVDEISSLSLTLSEESSFEGSINEEQEGGEVNVVLEGGSTWKLTGDSYITSFEGSLEQIDSNGYTLYIDGTAQEL
ncbi:MAG: hypothetical protein NC300_03855 [Bacteroidales bacterium]|nr:hypothetical protein [Clostridium sp.]MCM1203255.1 hypothetical protein [Bacteroidales bacterium]